MLPKRSLVLTYKDNCSIVRVDVLADNVEEGQVSSEEFRKPQDQVVVLFGPNVTWATTCCSPIRNAPIGVIGNFLTGVLSRDIDATVIIRW